MSVVNKRHDDDCECPKCEPPEQPRVDQLLWELHDLLGDVSIDVLPWEPKGVQVRAGKHHTCLPTFEESLEALVPLVAASVALVTKPNQPDPRAEASA